MAFELGEGTPADVEDMITIILLGFESDELWSIMMRNVTPEDKRANARQIFEKRFQLPKFPFIVIKDKETSKVVAWTSLRYPTVRSPEHQEIEDAKPKTCPGVDEELQKVFMGLMLRTKDLGYDREKHFHRRGTFVHPDYHRRGLATWMTRHCNEIADREGIATYVGARPSSIHMFQRCGFQDIGEEYFDLTRWGGSKEGGRNWYLRRDPGPLEDQTKS